MKDNNVYKAGPAADPDDIDLNVGREALTLMHLEQPPGCLTPAQIAFALGNDPDYIDALIAYDDDQSSVWSESALHVRDVGGDPGEVEVHLIEARAWGSTAQTKRGALAWLESHPAAPPVDFQLDDELLAVRRAGDSKVRAWRECSGPECAEESRECPVHGTRVVELEDAYDRSVETLRARFLVLSRANDKVPEAVPGSTAR